VKRPGRRAFLILIAAALLLWAVWPRERLLLRIATPVASAPDGEAGPLSPSYQWLSDHELLIAAPREKMIFRQDIRTEIRTPVPGLATMWGAKPGNPSATIYQAGQAGFVSPDGKWTLLDVVLIIGGGGIGYQAVATDGSRRLLPLVKDRFGLCWLPDSRHWIEVEASVVKAEIKPPRVLLRSVDHPQVPDAICTLPPEMAKPDAVAFGTYANAAGHLVWLIQQEGDEKTGLVESREIDLLASVPTERKSTFALPPGAAIPDTGAPNLQIASPQRDRLAWTLDFDATPRLLTLLHRFIPAIKAPPHPIRGIWVSRADGSDMHEVGHLPLKSGDADTDEPKEVTWLPDGKRLSFIARGRIWTVPAD
jgi:hypothetical protein